MAAKIPAAGVDLDGAITLNESSADVDFRVESNSNTHMLFVDGGNDRVGIGTTPDLGVGLHIRTADSSADTHTSADELVLENSGHCGISILSGTSSTGNIYFNDSGGIIGYIEYNHSDNNFEFGTGGSTRFRIRDTGSVHIDSAGESSGGGAEAYAAYITNAQASNANGIYNYFDGGAPDTGSTYFMVNQDTSTNRCIIFANGNIGNHDNSYGAISDERIKQDITDVNSQWDDIKNLKVRNFKMKDDVRDYGDKAEKRIGLIAQEAETVSPGLIQLAKPSSGDIKSDASFGTLDEDGNVKEIKEQVKHIKYSVLYMKAIKALQEAMAKIETLETKVKALEDA